MEAREICESANSLILKRECIFSRYQDKILNSLPRGHCRTIDARSRPTRRDLKIRIKFKGTILARFARESRLLLDLNETVVSRRISYCDRSPVVESHLSFFLSQLKLSAHDSRD